MLHTLLDHEVTEAVYQATDEFLSQHEDLQQQIQHHVGALNSIMDVVPESLDRLGPGISFPLRSHSVRRKALLSYAGRVL